MKIRNLIIISFILIYSQSLSAQDEMLTLEKSIAAALINNDEIKIADIRIDKSKAKVNEISSQFYPTFTFAGTYSHLSDVPPFKINLPILPQPITIQEAVLDAFNFKLSFIQPLFTGFKLSSLQDAAESGLNADKYESNLKRNETVFTVTTAFWNYYKALQADKLVQANIVLVEKFLADANAHFANGMMTKMDVLKIEVRLNALLSKKVETGNSVEIARGAFNKAIGAEIDRKTGILPATEISEPINRQISELFSEALTSREELKQLNSRILASKDMETSALSEWYPSLALFGNLYYSKPNQRYFPIKDEFNDSWDIGVSLTWEFLNWGKTSSRTEQSRLQTKEIEHLKSNFDKNIQLQVYSEYLNLKKQYQLVKSFELLHESADENYRVTSERFHLQSASSSEMLDAETGLLEVKINKSIAEADYMIAIKKFDLVMGKSLW